MSQKRHITLLLEQATPADIQQLQRYCEHLGVEYEYLYARKSTYVTYTPEVGETVPLFYFSVVANTTVYEQLQAYMNQRLRLCGHGKLCNAADQGDAFEQEFRTCLDLMENANHLQHMANTAFTQFLMPIKDVKVLQELEHYSGHMNQHLQACLQTRIRMLSQQEALLEEQMAEEIKALSVDIKELRTEFHLTRQEFAFRFDIPYLTVEEWEQGNRLCPTYLYNLIKANLEQTTIPK